MQFFLFFLPDVSTLGVFFSDCSKDYVCTLFTNMIYIRTCMHTHEHVDLLLYLGTIKFTSRRHSDCPFGVSIYVDGLIDCRMSACCEHKYRPGRIGGRTGHFSLVHVTGSSPCTKCQKSEERGTVKATLGSIKSQKIWSSTSKNSSSATKISQVSCTGPTYVLVYMYVCVKQ